MKKRSFSLILALVLALCMLTGCGPATAGPDDGSAGDGGDEVLTLEYAEGTVLRMATGYNNAKTGLFFDAEVAGEGITLADGVTYQAGDLKPTWVEVQNVLKVAFENKYPVCHIRKQHAGNPFDDICYLKFKRVVWVKKCSGAGKIENKAEYCSTHTYDKVIYNFFMFFINPP